MQAEHGNRSRDLPACADEVVFLFGIMPRSGTNMLADMLNAHPAFNSPGIPDVPEPFLLANADGLTDFVRRVRSSWDDLYANPDPALDDVLLRSAWGGIEEYFLNRDLRDPDGAEASARGRYRLVRTPSVENLDLFTRLTSAKAIVIVREGQAILESGMRSFGWSFERSIHRLVESAALVHDHARTDRQLLVVRYEDLLADRDAELERVFDFLGLDASQLPADFAPKVRGSSALLDKGVYWEGVERPPDFNPLDRSAHWNPWQRDRYAWVAGSVMAEFGYVSKPVRSLVSVIRNRLYDIVWPIRRLAWEAARRIVPRTLRARLLWWRGARYRRAIVS